MELPTNATISVETLATVLNSSELNPPITITGLYLSPLAGDDAIGTLVRDITYKIDLSSVMDTINTDLGAVSANTVTLTFAVSEDLNGMTITFPGVTNPITIANGAFSISAADFNSFYTYWQNNITKQNAHFATLSTSGEVLLASELVISSISAVSSDTTVGDNGTIDLSGPPDIDRTAIVGEFSNNLHSLDATDVLNLVKADLQQYIDSGGAYNTYFSGQASISFSVIGLIGTAEVDIPGLGKKAITQGALTLTGDELKAFYNAWEQAHTSAQKLDIANIKISQELYSAKNFTSQINFINSSGEITLGNIKYVEVVPIATYHAEAKFTADIEYILA